MPLSVVTANRGKDYSIFEQMAPFVEKLVGTYNQSQQNKWDMELQNSIISAIESADDNNQSDELIKKLYEPSPYIDTEGAIKAADVAMGMMMKKELMTGGLTPQTAGQISGYGAGNIGLDNRKVLTMPNGDYKTEESISFEEDGVEILIPTIIDGVKVSDQEAIDHYHKTGEFLGKFNSVEEANKYAEQLHLRQQEKYKPQQPELVPDKKEWNEVYNIFSNLSGEINWDDTLGIIKQRLESGREIGAMGQQVLNMILGQKQKDPREEYTKNAGLTDEYMNRMYPEGEETGEVFDPNKFLQDNPDMEVTGFNSNTGSYSFGKKAEVKEPVKELDIETFQKTIGGEFDVSNINVSGTGMVNSFSMKPKEKPALPGEAKPTWEGNLSKAQAFISANPDFEITSTNPDSNSVTVSKKGTGTTSTDKITTTEMNYIDTQFEGVKTNEQYDTALNKINAIDPKLAKQAPAKEKIFKGNCDRAITAIKTCIDSSGKIKEGEFDKGITNEDAYQAFYNDLQEAIEEYKRATGQILDNPYLSYEDYLKSDIKPGKGLLYPSTWGQQKSVNQ